MTVSPSGSPGDDPQGHLLASDAEREAAVEQLRVAAADGRLTMEELADRCGLAYRARTEGELSALTRDLPQGRRTAAPLPVTAEIDEPGESYVAVFSGAERRGHWRVPRRSKAVAVFGGVELDMREARLAARDTYLTVVAVFGGVLITVPEGVEVRMSGVAVFGGKAVKVPPAPPGAPVIHVKCTAIFAGVEVKAESDGRRLLPGPPLPPLPPPP